MANFTLEDLTTGMLVETKNHTLFNVYKGTSFKDTKGKELKNLLISAQTEFPTICIDLEYYNNENFKRTFSDQREYDIIKVYQPNSPFFNTCSQSTLKKVIDEKSPSLQLLWDETKIIKIQPSIEKCEPNDLVMVSNDGLNWTRSYFSRYKNNKVFVYKDGGTRWSSYGKEVEYEYAYGPLVNESMEQTLKPFKEKSKRGFYL